MNKNFFTLSANLENGLVDGSRYIVTPNINRALQEIVEGFRIGVHSFSIIGTYGTGKSSFLLHLEQELLDETNQPLLLKNKSVLHEGGFEVLNIVGDMQSLSDLLLTKLQERMESESRDVLKLLKDYYERLKRQNKFLLIAIDEFGKVLEHAAKNNPEEELYFFQKLTEVINVPTRKIMLLTTLHQNFSSYAGNLNQNQKNEWKKVKGRFQEVVFAEPIEQLLLLAAEHISTEAKYNVADSGFYKIYRKAVDIKYVSAAFDFESASKLYPMDVFAAFALTRAIQRYGQNERSLFSFLNSRGSHSLSTFNPAEGYTYNLAEVYDYIADNFYSYFNEANSDSTGWRAIQLAIERVEGNDWKDAQQMKVAVKLIKTIGVINLFGNGGFTLNPADLSMYAETALGIEFASTVLHELSRLKIVRYAEYKKRVVLFEGSDINIEDEIVSAGLVVPRPVNFIEDLRLYFNNRVSPVKAYYYHRGTPRFFEYELRDTPELTIPMGDRDGYVQMIFSMTEGKYEELVQFSRGCKYAVIFAYFRNTEEIVNHIYNIQKYKYIIEKVLIDKSDRVALRELNSLIDYERAILNKSLRESLFSYGENVVWLYKGNVKTIRSQRDFNMLLSEVCNDVYSKTPIINNELINKHKLSSNISAAKAKYLQALLENSEQADLGFEKDKFPPEKSIYYTLLKDTGLHNEGMFMDCPTSENIATLWEACETFLHNSMEKPRKLSELVTLLSAQPYKIKDGLLEFWLPTYLYVKRQDYSLYGKNGQYIPNFNIELFDLMKKHLGEFKVKAYAVDGVKLQLFNQYRRFLHIDEKTSIKGSSFIETIKPFLFFYSKQLNDYAKNTRSLAHEETIRFRDVLAQSKDPEKAFLEDLPMALGYDDNKLHDEKAVQEYCRVIQRAVRELRSCYNQLIDRIEENLINKLGLSSGEYGEYIVEIRKRLSKVKPHLLTSRQKQFYQHVMAQFENRNEWYQSVCYAVLDAPLERLRDEQEPKLHDNLVFLFKECEQKAVLSESLNYKINEVEESRSEELENRLNKLLTGNTNLDVYTLMRMLQKRINNE